MAAELHKAKHFWRTQKTKCFIKCIPLFVSFYDTTFYLVWSHRSHFRPICAVETYSKNHNYIIDVKYVLVFEKYYWFYQYAYLYHCILKVPIKIAISKWVLTLQHKNANFFRFVKNYFIIFYFLTVTHLADGPELSIHLFWTLMPTALVNICNISTSLHLVFILATADPQIP